MRGFAVLSLPLLILLEALPVSAGTIYSVDFQPNAAFSGRPPVDFTGEEATAAAANSVFDGSNVWNYLSIDPAPTWTTDPSFSNLVDSNGNASTVGISFSGQVSAADDTPIDNNGSDGLENDYFLITTNTVSYTISGLPADTLVALFLYAPNFSNYDSGDPTGEPSRAFTLTANGDTIFVPSGTGTGNTALAYVMTDGSGDISGNWSTAGNEGDWSGFQIAFPAESGVPEPSGVVLLASGLAALAVAKGLNRLR